MFIGLHTIHAPLPVIKVGRIPNGLWELFHIGALEQEIQFSALRKYLSYFATGCNTGENSQGFWQELIDFTNWNFFSLFLLQL